MKILKTIGKIFLTLFIPLFLALIIATLKVKFNLKERLEVAQIFGHDPINAKLSYQIACQWFANYCVECVLIVILIMIWSKRKTALQRVLYFLPFLIFSIFFNNIYPLGIFSFIPMFLFGSIYHYLLNKNMVSSAAKGIIPFLSGQYLHHLGLSRICIIVGLLCIPLAWYIVYKDSYHAPLLAYIIILPVYFSPFIACKLYQSIVYKIYLWIKAGFSQNN